MSVWCLSGLFAAKPRHRVWKAKKATREKRQGNIPARSRMPSMAPKRTARRPHLVQARPLWMSGLPCPSLGRTPPLPHPFQRPSPVAQCFQTVPSSAKF